MDKFFSEAPEWSKTQSTDNDPDLAKQIADSCEAFRQLEGNEWLKLKPGLLIATPDGELIENTAAMAKGAKRINIAKQQDAGNKAQLMREKYREKWGKSGAVQRIAAVESVSVSTVYRWFAMGS
jgi:hypothetical protein